MFIIPWTAGGFSWTWTQWADWSSLPQLISPFTCKHGYGSNYFNMKWTGSISREGEGACWTQAKARWRQISCQITFFLVNFLLLSHFFLFFFLYSFGPFSQPIYYRSKDSTYTPYEICIGLFLKASFYHHVIEFLIHSGLFSDFAFGK